MAKLIAKQEEFQPMQAIFNSSPMEDIMMRQLEALDDPKADLAKEIEKTKAKVSVCKTLIDSAKVKIDAVRVNNLVGAAKHKKMQGALPEEHKVKRLGNGSK